MFSDKNLPEPLFITEIEKEISLSVIDEQDHIFFDNSLQMKSAFEPIFIKCF